MSGRVVQALIIMVGVLSMLWSTGAMWAYSKDGSVAEIANAVLSGDKFNAKQLGWIRERVEAEPAELKEASAARGDAVLRMFLLESDLSPKNREVSSASYDRINSAVS